MPRKGLAALPTRAGLHQVIRVVHVPRLHRISGDPFSSWWQHGGQWPVAKPEKPQVRRWQRGQGAQSTNPNEVFDGSTFQGAEIREGIEALGDNDSGAG